MDNGSYTMAAKLIKSVELHYTMIQFLLKISYPTRARRIIVLELSRTGSLDNAIVEFSLA